MNIQSLHILDRYAVYTAVALSVDDRAKDEAVADGEWVV